MGLAGELPAAVNQVRRGGWSDALLDPTRDTHAVGFVDGVLHLVGSNPRAVLHAVWALRDALAAGAPLDATLAASGTFHFRERVFHARFDAWPGTRAEVRVLSQLGATHCLVSHDWQGSRRSLQGYVTSPLFPNAVDPSEVEANRTGLRRLLDDCADHGLGAMLWLTELPCQGGPWVPEAQREAWLTRYDPDLLSDSGTYEGRVLCFGHERVRAFYRDLLTRFFADFPEVETFFVFGLDSGGEFCDAETCPRCRGLDAFTQRDRLLRFLAEEGAEIRPGLRVLTTGWKWDRDGETFLRRQAELPASVGVYLAAQKDGWQCERQAHDFLHDVRRVTAERGQTFIGYDNFHWGDDTVHRIGDIQDFPLGIGAKIRRWHALGADGVFDHWGNAPGDLWCNSVALRECFLDPGADPAATARHIAYRQFGAAAGAHVLAAWTAIERAHAALSDACLWSPQQWPAWYAGRKAWPLPGHAFGPASLTQTRQPPRRWDARVLNPADFAEALRTVGDAWAAAAPHWAEAIKHLESAIAAADESPLGYVHWWNGEKSPPTRRGHLQRQHRHAVAMLAAGREIGRHFALHARWEDADHDPAVYRRTAAEVLAEDVGACRAAAETFKTLGAPAGWPEAYAAKAMAIEKFLESGDSEAR